MFLLLLTCLVVLEATQASDDDGTDACSNKFSCEYNVLLKLIKLEQNVVQQEEKITSLIEALNEAKEIMATLNISLTENKRSFGSTYIRWGRTTCPGDAHLVYDGYVGGSFYTHSGSGVNPLCLPKDPIFDKHQDGFQDDYGRIYGAEYGTGSYSSWKYLHNHDIPCAVCRITRTDVLMVPARNLCHEGYVLEYKGYLMTNYNSKSASEYICVDDKPETISGGYSNKDGSVFCFVESVCGSLKCPPYKNGMELTCAVCSFSPAVDSTGLQPYA